VLSGFVMKAFKAIIIDVFEKDRFINRYSLNNETISVGRHPHCDIVLANSSISRRHAFISYKNGQWTITNQGKNGVYFKGKEIDQQDIMADNEFLIGPYRLLIKKIAVDKSCNIEASGKEETFIANITRNIQN